MQPNRILVKVFLLIGFLALFLIIKYQNEIRDIWLINVEKARINSDNFFGEDASNPDIPKQIDSAPRRHRPLSLLERETELQLYMGEPFKSFSKQDWEKFWHIVYGVFPKAIPDKPGLPKRMRQLTADEIAFELAEFYPQPFAYFKDEHWRALFDIILKK